MSLVRRVDFPTEGKPIKDTRAWPVFATSNPGPPAPPEEDPSSSCVLSLASLAFKRPMWYSLQSPGWKGKNGRVGRPMAAMKYNRIGNGIIKKEIARIGGQYLAAPHVVLTWPCSSGYETSRALSQRFAPGFPWCLLTTVSRVDDFLGALSKGTR